MFDEVLRHRLREMAGTHVRYGYRRLTVLLQREGWHGNAKRIYRLYREEGLMVRTSSDGRGRDARRVRIRRSVRPNHVLEHGFWCAMTARRMRWVRIESSELAGF